MIIKLLCDVANVGIRGVITGTAIYKGTLNFKEANDFSREINRVVMTVAKRIIPCLDVNDGRVSKVLILLS